MRVIKGFSAYALPLAVFVFSGIMLLVVHLKLDPPILILERFAPGWGWLEIVIVSLYGAFLAYKMQDPMKSPVWRLRAWSVFAFVFFGQLLLGILVDQRFLMTGELHLPIPMMIMGGPLYRMELSIMTLLFLSTVILSGPSWCSQLCYFGAIDNALARGNTRRQKIRKRTAIKFTLLILIIAVVLVLRWLRVPAVISTGLAIGFGVVGLGIIFFVSRKYHKMYHCILYCPIGTLVNYLKYINPFRMYIDTNCTFCMQCTKHCKYDALTSGDIRQLRPGITCTYCGDCIGACHVSSIKYRFLNMHPDKARKLYLFMTISLHVVFLALAKI